jgi:predicted DNA-binding protein
MKMKKKMSLHLKKDFKEKLRVLFKNQAKAKSQLIRMMIPTKMTMEEISSTLHNLHKRSLILHLNLLILKSK